MLSLNDKISIRQLQALLILEILGTGVIILPRRAAEFALQDGWVVIVVLTLTAMVYTYLIASVGKIYPNKSYLSYMTEILNKPIAIILSLGLVLKIIINLALEIRFFSEIIKQTMLFKTPFFATLTGILAVGAYCAAKGIETRGRIAEILIFAILIPLTIVVFIAALDVDFTNILPVMKTSPVEIAKGGFFCGVSFTGIESLLIIYPYLARPKNARKSAVIAVALIGLLMLVITVITIGKFGPYDVKRQLWPVLELMDVIEFPGNFIERQDALMISFWIVSVFSIVSAGLFYSAVLLKDIFKKSRHSIYILICVPIILYIAYIPKSIGEVIFYMDFMFVTFGMAYMIVIPAIVLLTAKIRKLGENK